MRVLKRQLRPRKPRQRLDPGKPRNVVTHRDDFIPKHISDMVRIRLTASIIPFGASGDVVFIPRDLADRFVPLYAKEV